MDVQGVKLEGLHVRAGTLLAVIDGALVDSHQGARREPQLMIILEWGIVQEWVAAVCKGISAHASSALAPLATTLDIRGDLVMKAEDMFLQHVTLVEGFIAEVAAVFAHPRRVVLVMVEVDVQLLLLNKQLSATSNLKLNKICRKNYLKIIYFTL